MRSPRYPQHPRLRLIETAAHICSQKLSCLTSVETTDIEILVACCWCSQHASGVVCLLLLFFLLLLGVCFRFGSSGSVCVCMKCMCMLIVC